MTDRKLLLKDLTGRDENKAQEAADYLINSADTELFKMLAEKSDFLFPFVRENVCKRITNAVKKSNFKNIIKFFGYYSPYYDDLSALLLAENADEELTDEIIELLENGNAAQKTYAAKYFSYIPDTAALEILSRYVFSDDENLSANCAEALGQMQDDVSFDIALDMLDSGDDFDRLKAVKFFVSYGRDYPLKEIFKVLKTSGMQENIAGQIPYMQSLSALLESEFKIDALYVLYHIITGIGEILPLSDIFQFELYQVLKSLIKENKTENINSGIIAAVLLNALSKFKTLTENQEYLFDEDKDTKNEIMSVQKLLNSAGSDFWAVQKKHIADDFAVNRDNALIILPIIREYRIKEAAGTVKELLKDSSEPVILEALNTLKAIGALEPAELEAVIAKIKDPNIKAPAENLKNMP